MSIDVYDLRLSLIWAESFLSLLPEPQPPAPRKFLGRATGYLNAFNQWHMGGTIGDADMGPPWAIEYARPFWRYYGKHTSGTILPKDTWRNLVPIHARLPVTVATKTLGLPVEARGYLYPFGLVLELSCVLAPAPDKTLELGKAVDAAQDVVTGQLKVQWSGQAPTSKGVKPFAGEALSHLRQATLGDKAQPEDEALQPFTLATFVRVEGEDPKDAPVQGGDAHKALQGLATWSPDWRNSALGKLVDQCADHKSGAPAGHVLFAKSNARVGWFPGPPTVKDPENQRFACYHRSQVCTAVHLEALTRFIRRFSARLKAKAKLGTVEEQCALNTVNVLGRMYGGSAGTYRSDSCRLYIEQNDLKDLIDGVLDYFGKPKLFIKP